MKNCYPPLTHLAAALLGAAAATMLLTHEPLGLSLTPRLEKTAANVMANVGDSCVPVRRPGSGTDPLPYRERTTSSVSAAIVIAARSLAARARLHAHTRVPSLWQAELLD